MREEGRKMENSPNILRLKQDYSSVDVNLCHCSLYTHCEVSSGNLFLSAQFSITSYTHSIAQEISVIFSLNWNNILIDSLFSSSHSSGSHHPII